MENKPAAKKKACLDEEANSHAGDAMAVLERFLLYGRHSLEFRAAELGWAIGLLSQARDCLLEIQEMEERENDGKQHA